MAEFVVAPFLEPVEYRMELVLRIVCEFPEDRDVARIADLLGQIDRIENELRFEECIFLGLGQEAEVDPDARTLEGLVDEAGVAAFIAGKQLEQPLHVGVFRALGDFRIEDAAGKFGGQRAGEKVDEFLLQFGLQTLDHPVETVSFLEMPLVRVAFHFVHEAFPLAAHGRDVDPVHGLEIGGIEARCQDRILRRDRHRVGHIQHRRPALFLGRSGLGDLAVGVHYSLPGVKLTSYSSAISR